MFKFVPRHSNIIATCKLFQNVEVKINHTTTFKINKRGYHVLNVHHRCAFHSSYSINHDNKREQTYSRVRAPWLASAFAKYSSAPPNIPEAPPVPAFTEAAPQLNALGEPTFESLGLGGWSPIGLVQNAFEFFHVTLDIPWWSCIMMGTIIVRIIVFPLVIMAQRNNALMHNHMPQITHLQNQMTQARLSGNALETARRSQEFMLFMKQKGLNPLKNGAPILLQAPFFISFFIGLRRMANCPVESMKGGGMYWFTDLTIPDPYYLLPILTSATLLLTIELGADQMKTSNQTGVIIKYVLRGIPLVMLPFSIHFPSAILCYWLSTNVISLGQVALLKIPAVRDFFKIPKTVKHDPSILAKPNKGAVQTMKDSWSNMKITRELEDRQRTDEMIFNKAGKGPIVKTYKFDPTKHLADVAAKPKK